MKLEFSRQIFDKKSSNVESHENSFIKYRLFLPDFHETRIFSTDFRLKKSSNVELHENPFRGSRLRGWTDGSTDSRNLIVAFQKKLRKALNMKQNYAVSAVKRHLNCTIVSIFVKKLHRLSDLLKHSAFL